MYLGHTVPDDGDIRKQVARKDGDIIRGLQECVPSVCRWIPPPSLMLRHCVHKGDRSLVTRVELSWFCKCKAVREEVLSVS